MKCAIPCVGTIDAAAVLVCYIPLSVITYGCCYLMLISVHPQHSREYAEFSIYGCLQCTMGYISWYCTARWIYYNNASSCRFKNKPTEQIPLITPLPLVADSEEAEGA